MSFRKIEDLLQIIIPFVFLTTMFYLVSQGNRYENMGMTQIEKRNIEESDIARRVSLLDERDRKRRMGKLPSPPSARHLDDGIQGDIPIEDLMKGLKGFL